MPRLLTLSRLIGAEPSPQIRKLFFRYAPQRVLYPSPAATPTSATETVFLKGRGIDYIYVDRIRPNELVVDAVPIAATGTATVLRIP